MSAAVLSAFHVLIFSIIIITPKGRWCHSCFTDEESEVQKARVT